ALDKLEVFATVEIIHNETTALSTHVLPTKDQLERPDITLWDFLSPRVVAQYTPPVVEPVGDRRSTWWVLAELGKRLGHDLVAQMVGEQAVKQSDDGLLATMMSGARCSFEELVSAQYVEVPHEIPAQWVEEHLDRLGGWRLAPEQLVAQLSGLSALGAAAPLCLTPRRQGRHLNAQFTYLGDGPEALMHPADAAASGVQDGEQVLVETTSGSIVCTLRVDAQLRVGTVSVPHGYEQANVNMLTSNRNADPLTGMALYSGIPVIVRPTTST
ncbi:MAG: molybdopterin dinucleotide binding domain-containing protein, partial [Mycobacteriales bacterium]